jgi:hypothetical protein
MTDQKGPVSKPRQAFVGSCVCGATRYVLVFKLPPVITSDTPTPQPGQPITEIYRCNCTLCHKTGYLHVRPAHGPSDFFLLAPTEPFTNLADYTKRSHWFFCKTCGVRCFTFGGEGELVDKDFRDAQEFGENPKVSDLGRLTVWHPKEVSGGASQYLSINGMTLDAKQEGLDLREWAEKKWLMYCDMLDEQEEERFDRPHVGGAY